MLSTDESIEKILAKCSRFKIRDYRNYTQQCIDDLEKLLLKLKSDKSDNSSSYELLFNIIQTINSSIDRTVLWKLKAKINEQCHQQLAQILCQLFQYLCQVDAECASNDQGKSIIRSILQWLRDDVDFYLTKSNSQNLHFAIYSCIEYYSLICKNLDQFLNDLFSHNPVEKTVSTCFQFRKSRKSIKNDSLSIIDYTTRLIIYLIESSLVTSTSLINEILRIFLIYAPNRRFSLYLVNQTDFYRTIIVPTLSNNNTHSFVECILNETAQSQTDSTDRCFVFVHIINLLTEFALHRDIEIESRLFAATFKYLFDGLVECGTTLSLWYVVKCLNNLLTTIGENSYLFANEINRIDLINSIVNYSSSIITKSTLGHGGFVLKQLHNNVLISCLSIFHNLSTFDKEILNRNIILNDICRPLFKSDVLHLRLLSSLIYTSLLTEHELENDTSCHLLCEQLFSSVQQAFFSPNYHLFDQISLSILLNSIKRVCNHKQFQIWIGKKHEYIELLFQILRQFHSTFEQQDETQILLESIWFLSFEYSCAKNIHSHDKYFALLIQIAETSANQSLQEAAKGILWQLRQTISIENESEQIIDFNQRQHIMFSYNHDSKELVNRICQLLRKAGYRTWIDTDDMQGSTLDCMAHAVEQSSVVIICMSEKYKQSPNCQSEAEYVYRLKKPFVPILLQSKYKPDGWLGMLLGTRLYIDFTKNDFQMNYDRLVKEIQKLTS